MKRGGSRPKARQVDPKIKASYTRPQYAQEPENPDYVSNIFSIDKSVLNGIIKIQAHARRKQVYKKLQTQVEALQTLVAERRKNRPNFEFALQEFVSKLQAKKLTPEAFYRICDMGYQKSISKERFTEVANMLGLKLNSSTLRRLILIFDEDVNDRITLVEYQQALEAYNVGAEKHFISDRGDNVPYVRYETVVMERFTELLKRSNTKEAELFNSCDQDQSGTISIDELTQTICELNPDMKNKEKAVIKQYFQILDHDKNGTISRDEFSRMMSQAKRAVATKQAQEL